MITFARVTLYTLGTHYTLIIVTHYRVKLATNCLMIFFLFQVQVPRAKYHRCGHPLSSAVVPLSVGALSAQRTIIIRLRWTAKRFGLTKDLYRCEYLAIIIIIIIRCWGVGNILFFTVHRLGTGDWTCTNMVPPHSRWWQYSIRLFYKTHTEFSTDAHAHTHIVCTRWIET